MCVYVPVSCLYMLCVSGLRRRELTPETACPSPLILPALLRVAVLCAERQRVRLEVRPGGEGRRCSCPGFLSSCLETLQATRELTALSVLSDGLTKPGCRHIFGVYMEV